MSTDAFWALVDRARSEASNAADVGEVAARFADVLAEQDPAFIANVAHELRTAMAAGYGWPLWGAAYLIRGGCSDDGFDYFLAWLVGQGRETFQAAFADPDSLADLPDEVLEDSGDDEEMLNAPWVAYRRAADADLPLQPVPRPDLGEGWDFDDPAEMSARYPRLWERFGGQ